MGIDRDEAQELSPLKRALFAVRDLRGRLEAIERERVEPIAIIGMGCRFPGAADLESYWRLLEGGVDAIREVPRDRWDVEAYYDPDPDAAGKTYCREGGFLEQIDRFDAGLFGISPREVASMDPQQRLLLEVTWEALEHAGIPPARIAGEKAGVFVGISTSDYTQLTIANQDTGRVDAYMGTGSAWCVAAGRIAYILGLHGPTVALDTACSSSLVSIDLAVHELRNRRCHLAIAGGVNVMITPSSTIYLSKMRALSRNNRCRSFDASADGYVRGEGCGMIVLKRLSDAQRDGDHVLAVIRGSATNHDGRSSGLTVPNGQAQQAVIRDALADGGLSPVDVQYVEAHGTGTPLGDPIELRALGAVLGTDRSADDPVFVGTVKTNIGHLEAAAGVAGVIKVVLAIQHRTIPPILHFEAPNPNIPWNELPVRVATRAMPWPSPDRVPLAGVSAYGFSGTNAHVLIEAAPATVDPLAAGQPPTERTAHLLTLSAASVQALRELATRHVTYYTAHPDLDAGTVAHAAHVSRAHLDHRVAVVGADLARFGKALEAFASGKPHADAAVGQVQGERPKVAFLFTGQGSQYVGMARELYETHPQFRETLDRCDDLLRPRLARPLLSVVFADPQSEDAGLIDQTGYTQPALFAIEYALAELWRSFGVEPACVMGHSVGEYAAACVAGLFSLEDGLRLVAARAALMQSLPAGGRMAAVFAPEEVVAPLVASHAAELSIAAINGPEHVVISGGGGAVSGLLRELDARGIRSKDLVVSHAFHSPLMEPILGEFERELATVRFLPPRTRIVSNLTGRVADPRELSEAAYWLRHLREAVRFADSITAMHAQGCRVFVEIGPEPVLLGMASRCVQADDSAWLPSIRRRVDDRQQMLRSAGALWTHGAAIDLKAIESEGDPRQVRLPNYPFQRERYWVDAGSRRQGVAAGTPEDQVGHPLLGHAVQAAVLKEHVFEVTLSADSPGFVAEHVVWGTPVFPATGYLEMALAGTRAALAGDVNAVKDFAIEEPLVFSRGESRIVQITVDRHEDDGASFQVFSRPAAAAEGDGTWTRHASGRVLTDQAREAASAVDQLLTIRNRCTGAVDAARLYEQLKERGIEYGPRFQGMTEIWAGKNEAIARIEVPSVLEQEFDEYVIHPAFLDSALQVLGAAVGASAEVANDSIYLPVGIGRMQFVGGGVTHSLWSHAIVRDTSATETLTADIRWLDDQGGLVLEATGVMLRRASTALLRRAADRQLANWLYEVDWQQVNVPALSPTSGGSWLVVGDAPEVTSTLADDLAARGVRCCVATTAEEFAWAENRPGLDPANKEHWERLVAHCEEGGPLDGIVHALALNGTEESVSLADVARGQHRNCGSLLAMIQALGEREGAPPRVLIATRGAQAVGLAPWAVQAEQATLWGMARVIAAEQPALRCSLVDLDPAAPASEAEQLSREMLAGGGETEVALRGGNRFVSRLVRRSSAHGGDRRLALPPGDSFQLATAGRGVLDNLRIEPRERRAPGPGEIEVEVRASGLNFRDVLNALGMYPGDPGPMGGECAGRVVAVGDGVEHFRVGDDVLCLAGGAFSRYVATPWQAAARLPAGMTYQQGAGIPVTFLTAWFGLHKLAGLKAGQRVLIHAAAGGVGLAAVQIALRAGAEVYGTAGSEEKRDFVRSMGVRQVFSSRTADFSDPLLLATGGRGVDVVLNSLTGEFIPASLQVLAAGGHFLEIGKAEIWPEDKVAALNPAITYRPFDLAQVMATDLDCIATMLSEVMAGFEQGWLKPLPTRTFELQDAVSAFRLMAQAKHVGKVVLVQHDQHARAMEDEVALDPGAAYLITGGCGGLGIKVAEWMADRGARHLFLAGRSNPSPVAARAIGRMQQQGIHVATLAADVANEEDVRRVLAEISGASLRLAGIVHAAGVLEDGVLLKQSWSRFEKVFAPKLLGAWLLDRHTRNQRLDFFVLFSSTSAVLGSPGQANYAAANAYLDALAAARAAQGRPALSVNWGAWSEVGMAARLAERDRGKIGDRGIGVIGADQGTRLLGHLLRQPASNVIVLPARWREVLQSFAADAEPPLLRVIARDARPVKKAGSKLTAGQDLASRLKIADPVARKQMLLSLVRAEVVGVLGLRDEHVLTSETSFGTLGLDSLMALEVRNRLSRALSAPLGPSILFDYPSVGALADHLATITGAADHSALPAQESGDPGIVDGMSDEQVNALLQSLLSERQGIPGSGSLT